MEERLEQILGLRRVNEARTKAYRAPDTLEYHGHFFAYTSNEALTFSVVADSLIVWTTHGHPLLLNMLSEFAADALKKSWSAQPLTLEKLRKFDIYFSHKPTVAELNWILEQGDLVLEEFRRKFKCGRAWKNVNLRNEGLTSLISFWCLQAEVNENVIRQVVETLDLQGQLVIQYIDTEEPVVHSKETAKTTKFVSKRHPELTHADLIDIRTKYHTRPQDLNTVDWDVLDEVFGIKKESEAPKTRRGLGAIFNYFRGESRAAKVVAQLLN